MPERTRRPARFGVLSISDRASRGEYEDRSGPAIRSYLEEVVASPFEIHARLVPDRQDEIEAALVELADEVGCDLVVASGGTGPAPRDLTPEAFEKVIERRLPGFGELMRRVSLDEVPTAILSRQEAGTRGRTLVVTLPGSPRAVRTCLDAIFPAVPDCLDLIGAARIETDPAKVRAYRPHGER